MKYIYNASFERDVFLLEVGKCGSGRAGYFIMVKVKDYKAGS